MALGQQLLPVQKEMNLKERAKKLKLNIYAIYLSIKDKDTPVLAKILAGITVAYALSPIDLIPDFIPVLGYLDDLILLPILITLTLKFIPKEIFERNSEKAKNIMLNAKMKKWYFAIPIILIWMVFFALLIWLIFK